MGVAIELLEISEEVPLSAAGVVSVTLGV